MYVIIAAYIFLLGLCFGSFALAVADRTRRGKNWVMARSACDSCKRTLTVRDLIPVLSWLSTGGKCRHCGARLSLLYPLVEISMALAFLISFLNVSPIAGWAEAAELVLWLIGLVIMGILLIIDARSKLLPYKFLFPLVAIAGIHGLVHTITNGQSVLHVFGLLVAAVAVGGGLFMLLYIVSKGAWIGDGDIFLGTAIGLFLAEPLLAWLALVLASLFGLVFSLFFVLKHKKPLRHLKIPFGPFLIAGLFVAYLYGQPIADWYLHSLLLL